MTSIILAATDEVKAKAKAMGFTEQTILIRHNAVRSNAENKAKLEREMFALKPHAFLVSDYWGAGAD